VQLVVGISGASGAIYGVRLVEALRFLDVGVDLVVSTAGASTLRHETGMKVDGPGAAGDDRAPGARPRGGRSPAAPTGRTGWSSPRAR
jgi:4-hydroxy-3-polyprenylbenzoate decarboxylase